MALRLEPLLRPQDTAFDAPVVLPSLEAVRGERDAMAWVEKHTVKCTELGIRKCVDCTLRPSFVESINEYLGAINSHRCYWASQDVMLFVLAMVTLDDGAAMLASGGDGRGAATASGATGGVGPVGLR